jgi:hypothetical protein
LILEGDDFSRDFFALVEYPELYFRVLFFFAMHLNFGISFAVEHWFGDLFEWLCEKWETPEKKRKPFEANRSLSSNEDEKQNLV